MIKVSPPFRTIRDLFVSYGLIKKRTEDWRLTEPLVGQIHGLDSTHGILLATNGILCLIRIHNEPILFEGHIDFFVPYNPQISAVKTQDGIEIKLKRDKKKQDRITDELLEKLLNV